MTASEGYAEFLREQLAPLGLFTLRRMFGKSGVFCSGVMLAMVADDALYLRLDDCNRAIMAEVAWAPPLSYVKGGKTIDLTF